jgi:hypothetical protein
MAIQISGCTVIDNSRNINAGIATFTDIDVDPKPIAFSPADGATIDPATLNSIQISFNVPSLIKGTGNITLRSGSAGGTILETIPISSGTVTISAGVVTINPESDNLPGLTDVYVVVDAGAFLGFSNTSQSALINTYNFTIGQFALGSSFQGGLLICNSSPTRWVVAPLAGEVSRTWYLRNDANTTAQSVSGCTGWFVPTVSQLQNPGFCCRAYWDSFCATNFWSSTELNVCHACLVSFNNGNATNVRKDNTLCVRAFRCVTY